MKIELSDISHSNLKGSLLKALNVVLESGETLVISGRSGSGKSLLFSVMCGILAPLKGKVLVDGKCLFAMDEGQNLAFRRELGVVFEVSALLSNLTLKENLLLPLNLYFPDEPLSKKLAQVEKVSHEFGLEKYLEWRIDELSSGQAALAGLARALIIEPKCLIWDAPLSEVDVKWNAYICRRLRLLKEHGTTMILFTNRQHLIDEFADSHMELCDGRLKVVESLGSKLDAS